MAGCGMEVDSQHNSMGFEPLATSQSAPISGMNPLKRSNSAPTINVLVSSTSDLSVSCISTAVTSSCSVSFSTVTSQPSISSFGIPHEPRARRFSCSGMMLHSPTTPVKNRLVQIKHEESLSQGQREVAHEREVQMTQQVYRSWENLAVDESVAMLTEPAAATRPKSLGEPLHIQTSLSGYASSPSPTRALGRQCFSPSLQQTVRSSVLSPSPSPSPTRKSFRRSISPITLRPSPLGGLGTKRKMESDWSDRSESYPSPAKRFHYSPLVSSPVTPDRVTLNVSPFALPCNSNSSSSMASDISDNQRIPSFSTPLSSSSSCYSSNTFPPPISSSSTPSPCYMFRTVRDSVESSHGTDSETSDMTETTDMSEQTEASFHHTDSNPHSSEQREAMITAVGRHVTAMSQSESSVHHCDNASDTQMVAKSLSGVMQPGQNNTLTFNCQMGFPSTDRLRVNGSGNPLNDVSCASTESLASNLPSVTSTSQTVGQ